MMTALRLSLTVAALAIAPFTGAVAQDTLSAGDKVRVTTEEERIVGSLVSADATQLMLSAEQSGLQLALAFDSVSKLEVSREKDYALAGFGLGFLAGLGSVVIVSEAAGWNDEDDEGGLEKIGERFAIALGLVIGGFVVGTVIGSHITSDRWQEVPLDNLRVSFIPITPHGLGATVRVRWSP